MLIGEKGDDCPIFFITKRTRRLERHRSTNEIKKLVCRLKHHQSIGADQRRRDLEHHETVGGIPPAVTARFRAVLVIFVPGPTPEVQALTAIPVAGGAPLRIDLPTKRELVWIEV